VGAIGASALFVFVVFAEWAIRANPELTVMPGGAMPGIGTRADEGSISMHLIAAAGFGVHSARRASLRRAVPSAQSP
jgi:hypothetical protein